MRVDLVDIEGNPSSFGTKVEVDVEEKGGKTRTRSNRSSTSSFG